MNEARENIALAAAHDSGDIPLLIRVDIGFSNRKQNRYEANVPSLGRP
jgi:hypothetical protein